jgi:glucosamine--fructose-6-phosphate aminotransferase (isomerizing)
MNPGPCKIEIASSEKSVLAMTSGVTKQEKNMNLKDAKYQSFLLVKEMMETVTIVDNFDSAITKNIAKEIKKAGKLMLTGEGSSRIFPAKNAIRKSLTWGMEQYIATDGSAQCAQYDLSKFAVFHASNSGRTKEVVLLAKKLAENKYRYALTANRGTLLEEACTQTFVLNCGWEQAVAATKSVVEQALFYESVVWHIMGMEKELTGLPVKIESVLTMMIDPDIIQLAVKAPTIYFAGYNDGVAEELTLKTNEITRKKSDFLEGTYAVHGIEEVMEKNDIVFVIDPIEDEIEKFKEVLIEGVGLNVVAIADRQTSLPTIQVPYAGTFAPYLFLCAGWNLLVETGIALGINLDKPERARKVGNELIL